MTRLVRKTFLSRLDRELETLKKRRQFSRSRRRLYSDIEKLAEDAHKILEEEGVLESVEQSRRRAYRRPYFSEAEDEDIETMLEEDIEFAFEVVEKELGAKNVEQSFEEALEIAVNLSTNAQKKLARIGENIIESTLEEVEEIVAESKMYAVSEADLGELKTKFEDVLDKVFKQKYGDQIRAAENLGYASEQVGVFGTLIPVTVGALSEYAVAHGALQSHDMTMACIAAFAVLGIGSLIGTAVSKIKRWRQESKRKAFIQKYISRFLEEAKKASDALEVYEIMLKMVEEAKEELASQK